MTLPPKPRTHTARHCTWHSPGEQPPATYVLKPVVRGYKWLTHSYGVCPAHFDQAVATLKRNSGARLIAVFHPDSGRVTDA